MLKKRLMSMFLALTMVVGLGSQAFAAEIQTANIEAEIENRKEVIFAEVYNQLEAQNALALMDLYINILTPEIEESVKAKYFPSTRANDISLRASRGGTLKYIQSGSLATIRKIYLDATDTQKLFDESDDKITCMSILTGILGVTLPAPYDAAAGSLFAITILKNHINKAPIRDCGGYSYILHTYDPVENASASVVLAWTNYPYVYLDVTGVVDKSIRWTDKGGTEEK